MAFFRIWFCSLVFLGHSISAHATSLTEMPTDVMRIIGQKSENIKALRATCRSLRDKDYRVPYVLTLPRDFSPPRTLHLNGVTTLNLYNFTPEQIGAVTYKRDEEQNNGTVIVDWSVSDPIQDLLKGMTNLQLVVLRLKDDVTIGLHHAEFVLHYSKTPFVHRVKKPDSETFFPFRAQLIESYNEAPCHCKSTPCYIKFSQIQKEIFLMNFFKNHVLCVDSDPWIKKHVKKLSPSSQTQIFDIYDAIASIPSFTLHRYKNEKRESDVFIKILVYLIDKPSTTNCLVTLLNGPIMDLDYFFNSRQNEDRLLTLQKLNDLNPKDSNQIVTLLQEFVRNHALYRISGTRTEQRIRLNNLIFWQARRVYREWFQQDEQDFLNCFISVVCQIDKPHQLYFVERFTSLATFEDLFRAATQEYVVMTGTPQEALDRQLIKIIKIGFSHIHKGIKGMDQDTFKNFLTFMQNNEIHINVFAKDARALLRQAQTRFPTEKG
ncbi:MAG: hypothetical protein KBB83_06055 [Alphaproteobacteria bacterium]|nr:hypothetical protein [Alphaproteobacteria bacterium]